MDEHTKDLGSVIIVSATDADGREAAKVLQAFHARHKGARQAASAEEQVRRADCAALRVSVRVAGQVMRAWATAEDQYAAQMQKMRP